MIATLSIIALLMILGAPASASVSQQSQAPIGLNIILFFDATNNQPIPYRLLPLLQAHGVSVVNPVVTEILPQVNPPIRVAPDPSNPGDLLLIADPPGGLARVTIQAQDANTGAPVTIELNLLVVGYQNVPPPPPPQQAQLVPFPAFVTLCVGETRTIYVEAQVNAGGLLHRGPADILWLDAPGAAGVIGLQPLPMGSFPGGTPLPPPVAQGGIQVTGLAPGTVTLTVWGQMQPLGLAPSTDVVSTTISINVINCPAPAPAGFNSPCPAGFTPVGGRTPLPIPNLQPIPPQTTRFPPPAFAMPAPPMPGLNFVGLERFEVGVTPGLGAGLRQQWSFPTGRPAVINLARGERRELLGERTDFFAWGAAYLDPNPPQPSPDRRFATRWVAYRGYFRCAAPVNAIKFHDVNGNGRLDAAENLLVGWPIQVVDPLSKVPARGATSPENRLFSFLPDFPGVWTVMEEERRGVWRPTTPTSQTVAVTEQGADDPMDGWSMGKGLLEPSAALPIDPQLLQVPVHAAFGNQLVLAKAFDLPPPGVLVGIDEPFPKEIKTELVPMGLHGIPDEVPEDQRRPIRQEPKEPRLGVGLDPWTGRLVGSLCSTDIVVIIFRVCTATQPGVYRKFYDVFRVEGGTRERLTGLLLEIEIRGDRQGPGPPQPGRVVLTVRAVDQSTGQSVRAPIDYEIFSSQGQQVGSGRGTTEFHLQVPKGGRVRLTARDTQTLEFQQWRGALPEVNPVITEPLNQNAVVIAEYKSRGGGQKVTLTVRSWRMSQTSPVPPQQISGVPIAGQPPNCSGTTPYQCQVDKNTKVALKAPPTISIGGVPHVFVQWWVCPANHVTPPAQPACSPIPPGFPKEGVAVLMDQSKTLVAVYAAAIEPPPPPPPGNT